MRVTKIYGNLSVCDNIHPSASDRTHLILMQRVIQSGHNDRLSFGESLSELVLVIISFLELILPLLLPKLEEKGLLRGRGVEVGVCVRESVNI